MTTYEMYTLFEKFNDEFLKSELIKEPFSKRPDLHAFILLDKLVPSKFDIVSAAEHDEIWLDINIEDLAAVATEDIVRDLVRCGVRYSEDALCVFV